MLKMDEPTYLQARVVPRAIASQDDLTTQAKTWELCMQMNMEVIQHIANSQEEMYDGENEEAVNVESIGSSDQSPPSEEINERDAWGKDEDQLLMDAVEASENKATWNEIALSLPVRTGPECAQRWIKHVCPTICKDPQTKEQKSIRFEAYYVSADRRCQ